MEPLDRVDHHMLCGTTDSLIRQFGMSRTRATSLIHGPVEYPPQCRTRGQNHGAGTLPPTTNNRGRTQRARTPFPLYMCRIYQS